MWIDRKLESNIIEAVKTRPVVLLTGIRQTGKDLFFYQDQNGVEIDFIDRSKRE